MPRWIASLLLALALLASQGLGLSHAVLHGAPQAAAAPTAHDHGGHTPGSTLCHLLDHLWLDGGVPSTPAPALALTHATQPAPTARAWLLPALRPDRPYAARAPPARA